MTQQPTIDFVNYAPPADQEDDLHEKGTSRSVWRRQVRRRPTWMRGTRAADIGTTPGRASEPEAVFGATDTMRGWVVALVLTAIGAVTRFWNLSVPADKGTPVFDEKHYVPQAWQVLTGGDWIEDNPGYGLVVHPPVGKWMIALGEWLFGYSPLGWRFTAAVCGTLMILIVIRLVRRLSRSTLVGAIAGVLMICDGVLFVQSRMGMLDIFQAFFVLAALACLVADRDQMRARLHVAYLQGRIDDSPYGPRLGFRWWRFGSGILLGLACGTKWSGIYFVIFFLLLALGSDVANRYAYRVQRPWRGVLVRDLVPQVASTAVLPVLVYMATWTPWFASETSVYRYQVGNQVGVGGTWSWVPDAWRSLWYYQAGVLKFHEELTNSAGYHHPWESKPWTWPMSLRPMLYYYESGPDQCGGGECVRAQMLIGSPAMWWLALPMLLWALWCAVVRRDWRYTVVVVAYGASYLPWFANLDRQMYFFYATAMAPFLVMGLALAIGDLLGHSPRRRPDAVGVRDQGPGQDWRIARTGIGCFYLMLVVVNFIWLWPILTGEPISPLEWSRQIWLPSWG